MSVDHLTGINYERNIWSHVTRGLEGIVVLCESYVKEHLYGCPRKDMIVCADRLRELADNSLAEGKVDDDQHTYLRGKK